MRKDGSVTRSEGAARGYSWPPFEEGNTAAVKHGTRSERLVAERAGAVRSLLLEHHEFLADPVFEEALVRYCRVEARAQMLDAYIWKIVEEKGVEAVPKTIWADATRTDALAQKAAQDLGLDPTGFARAARDLGIAKSFGQRVGAQRIAALTEQGRQLREATS